MTMNGAPLVMGGKTDIPVSDATGLASAARAASTKGPPPVHLWNPPFCGDLDMEIRADGSWFYQGTPIGRPAMVQLFASILKRESDDYFLVTPVEKVGIRVVDVPFIAVDAEIGEDILFTTNVGDSVKAGPDHAIEIRGTLEAPRPYVHVRRGLWARIGQSIERLAVDAARPDDRGRLVLHSGGETFPLET